MAARAARWDAQAGSCLPRLPRSRIRPPGGLRSRGPSIRPEPGRSEEGGVRTVDTRDASPAEQDQDTADLAGFGDKQELRRTLGVFSSFAVAFSYISPSTGIFALYYLGLVAIGGWLVLR